MRIGKGPATVAGILLGLGTGVASAAPFIPPRDTPLYTHLTNAEQLDTTGDNAIDTPSGDPEGNWGIFQVDSIQEGFVATEGKDITGSGDTLFSDRIHPPGSEGQITGIFHGLQVENITNADGSTLVDSSGGQIDLYWDEAGLTEGGTVVEIGDGSNPPGARTADDQYPGFTDGIFLGTLDLAPGVIDGDSTTTVRGSFDSTTDIGSGNADGYADVADVNGDGVIDSDDGLWASALNSDWFQVDLNGDGTDETSRDIRFSNGTNGMASWDGTEGVVGLRSSDPLRAVSVPEPGMLGLMGAGLVLLATASARRRLGAF
jgi:hypothetical protein